MIKSWTGCRKIVKKLWTNHEQSPEQVQNKTWKGCDKIVVKNSNKTQTRREKNHEQVMNKSWTSHEHLKNKSWAIHGPAMYKLRQLIYNFSWNNLIQNNFTWHLRSTSMGGLVV